MPDSNDFLNIIKKVVKETNEACKLTEVVFGKVINESPLQINVEQKMTLSKAQLILTRNVTDFIVKTDQDKITVYNSLVVGDDVILLRMQGGQKFIVLDRIVT